MPTETLTELTEDGFDDLYPLLRNHLNPQAGWAYDEERGCMFETYGEELAFILEQDPRNVWTLVDGDGHDDEADQFLVNGIHFVNRIGYLVSTRQWPEDACIQVPLRWDC